MMNRGPHKGMDMDGDIDIHSHPSDELMNVISCLDNPNDPNLYMGRMHVSPHLQQQQQQQQHPHQRTPMMHNREQMPVKIEGYPHMQQQQQNYFGNQPNVYYQQQQQQQQNHAMNFQSPAGSPHPMGHPPIHHNVPSPSHGPPQSPIRNQLPIIDNSFSSGVINTLKSLNTVSLLEEVYRLQKLQKDRLNKVRQYQKGVMMSPNKSGFETLDQQHRQMKEHIDGELSALQQLYTQVILQPHEINRLLLLVQELKIQQTQLELFRQELHQLTQSHAPRCIATLMVSQEPFPMVITKGKQLDDDAVIVQLLCGANVEFQSFSQMKVAMIWENQHSKANNQKNIDCDTQTVDAFNRLAKWHLKFLSGTRKNSVTLRFGMQVQVQQPNGPVALTVESHCTRPFIVITNECQWEESEGTLLKKDAFGEQEEIPWPHFANVLQRHFLRATRQDTAAISRCLSASDFDYIHQKFFGGHNSVTPHAYSAFWTWFGKTVKKLRYQRHIFPLWQSGIIHGFLSREAVHELLKDEEPGTFLVRFSERHSGQFAVAYRVDDDQIRHYLVRPDDTAGNKKTLPDFLSEQSAFCSLLQIGQTDENGVKTYQKLPKDSALGQYTSKRNALPPAVGYDSNIIAYQSPMVVMDKEVLDAE